MLRHGRALLVFKRRMTKDINPYVTEGNMEFSFEKLRDQIEQMVSKKGPVRYDKPVSQAVEEKFQEMRDDIDKGKRPQYSETVVNAAFAKPAYEKIYDASLLRQTTSDPEYQYPARSRFAEAERRRWFFIKCALAAVAALVTWFLVRTYRAWRAGVIEAQLQEVREAAIAEGLRRQRAALGT